MIIAFISFQNRCIAPNRLFMSLVAAEGGAVAARGMVTWNRGEDYYTADDWHGVLAREGGGLMINQAIHNLDMLLQAFPEEIVSVRGNTDLWYNAPFSEVEDNSNFIVNFASGKRIVFFGTNDYAVTAPIFYEVTTASGKRITGMDGKIFRNGQMVEAVEENLKADGKNCWGYGHRICIREFYEAIVNGTEVPVPLASAARTMRVLFALYRSHGEDFYLTDL
jgi:predicted dehydrogenase